MFDVSGPSRLWRDRILIALLPLFIQLPGLLGLIDIDPQLTLTSLGVGGSSGLLAGQAGWLDTNVGFTTQALGRASAESWLSGSVPWWNPYSGVGLPLAAEMQPASLFLPFVLLLHFDSGWLLLRIILQIIGGVATHQLLRELRLAPQACLVGGLLAVLGGTYAWLPDAPSHPIAFLPVVLCGVERARRAACERRRGGWVWISVGLALSLTAGFPETAFIDGLLVVCWSLWRLLQPQFHGRGNGTVGQVGMLRARFLMKLGAGTTAALLLSSPAVWPFLHLLARANLGMHAGFAHAALRTAAFPMFVIPYIYGNLATGGGPDGPTWWLWGQVGGYVGVTCAALAVTGLLNWRGREYGLRLVLGVWILACLGKTAALPGVTEAFNLLPSIAEAAFFRYSEPAWTFACIILAAFAVDAWLARQLSRPLIIVSGLCAMAASGLLAACAWPTIHQLAASPVYTATSILLLEWSAGLAIAIFVILSIAPKTNRVRALVVFVSLDAIFNYGLPLLASSRHRSVDLAPVEFLRKHLGLQRFYSLGSIAPNYAAYYGLASINETAVPRPRVWDAVVSRLDPLADPIAFDGRDRDGGSDRQPMHALLTHAGVYRDLSVKYIVMPRGTETASHAAMLAPPGPQTPLELRPNEMVEGAIPAARLTEGARIIALAVRIGTYDGSSDGMLSAELCASDHCAHAQMPLSTAADNADLLLTLDPALPVIAGNSWTFRLVHEGGTNAVAIWTTPESAASITKPVEHAGPVMSLVYPPANDLLRPVFQDPAVEIFELRGAVPYFTADSQCDLKVTDRMTVEADCASPTKLIRRELSFPGWTANVNGSNAPLHEEGIFSAVPLPAGHSRVRFAYVPPGAEYAWLAAFLGAVWVLSVAVMARRDASPRLEVSS